MRIFRVCLFLFASLTGSLLFAQKEDWLPVTQEDLQVKEVPGNPGAPAIQLYYADHVDDTEHNDFIYRRIKILTDEGKKYADVEIPLFRTYSSVKDLKARTIHPDGNIIEFTGKPFEKTIIKGKGIKYLAKTFTLPEVTVGSIIEYKFLVAMSAGLVYDSSWTIQHDLYTVKESFHMKAYMGILRTRHGRGAQTTMFYSHMPPNLKPEKEKDGFKLEAENMPAFETEEYMPPQDNYRPQVRFFYGGSEISSADKFWQEIGREADSEAERFIGNHGEIQNAVAEAIGGETDPDKQLRKLYARAQQIRNLSYEHGRTQEELKKENLKDNQNVVDVLKHGYGNRQHIVLFFVALARAGGFNASVLRVSSRQHRFFDKALFFENQLDSEMALVKVKDQDVYLDPGTKFCSYGLIRWMRTSTAALKLDKDGGTFIATPSIPYDKAILRRNATLVLAEDGSLSGDITVQFQGSEALERRLDAIETDEAGRTKALEDELKGWLSSGAVVNLTKAEGWDGEDEPLTAQFHIQVPGYASAAGKRLLLPPYLFQIKHKDAFKHAERKFPLYFSYPFGELDVIRIKLPSGYTIEGSPKNQDVKVPYAAYQSAGKFESGQLLTQRVLLFNATFVEVKLYPEVKDFFSKVQAGDEQQAVLRMGGSTSAQKGN